MAVVAVSELHSQTYKEKSIWEKDFLQVLLDFVIVEPNCKCLLLLLLLEVVVKHAWKKYVQKYEKWSGLFFASAFEFKVET